MEPTANDTDPANPVISVRWPELGVALLLMVLALLVITDSMRVGTGWADDGPRSGYFPFYIGCALMASSAWIAISQLRHWQAAEDFATRTQLRSVFAILLPMTVYVGLITQLGIYLPSAALIGWFMLRHGRHGLALSAALSVGVPIFFFLVFERWFLVPLPKGPIEAWLGF